MNRAEALERIDALIAELARIDRKLDGHTDPETGEHTPGLLDAFAEAEDEWTMHRDVCIANLVEGEYQGRQLPGNDRIDALTRARSDEARKAYEQYRHLERLQKRLRERDERLQKMLSGRQSQAKRPDEPDSHQQPRGVPVHMQRRPMRGAA